MDLVTPDIGLIFWTTLSFLILLFILGKFAWKPILNSVNDRETSILKALKEAENAREEMKNLTANNERILKDARIEREAMIKEARDIKVKMISDAKEEAKITADAIISQAQEAIKNEKKSAMADLKSQMASLSIEIAEKVVKEELSNKDKQLKLVEDMLNDSALN